VSGRPVRKLLRAAGTKVLAFASRAYVPGPLLDDAMKWVRRMDRQGISCTLGYFDAEDEEPQAIGAQDRAAIDALAKIDRPGYVSFKVPSLGYDEAMLAQLALEAERRDQRIHFDSHGPETATPTIDALARLKSPGRRLSLTVPARWARSLADVDWAVANAVRVRVVKGQWACPENPDADLRETYLAVIDKLAGRGIEVAVATHDAPLARLALMRLKAAGTSCEMELLCGLPRRDALAVARDLDVPVRLYIPFGQAWLPYALDQAVRSPKMLWWMLRDTVNALR
jgi:proline dehydrogenase